MVGTRYMAHLATMLQGVGHRREHRRLSEDGRRSTTSICDGPEHTVSAGQIQSQGRTDATMAKVVGDGWRYKFIEMRHIPLWAYEMWVSRATDWLAMTEDLPRPENRVTMGRGGPLVLQYDPTTCAHTRSWSTELRGAHRATRLLVAEALRALDRHHNTTHQCGTLVFGDDPRTSVLDPFCRTHDVENLFVVDASFFPRRLR
jgi:choline dehydrogenase-like flavoprotein